MPTRAPRILVVVSAFPVVSQTAVVDHLRGMLRHGWEVHLACLELDVGLLRRHRELAQGLATIHVLGADAVRPANPATRASRLLTVGRGFRRTRTSPLLRRATYLAAPLARVVRTVSPDLVHAHWGHNALGAAIAVRGRVPLVAELHGFDLTKTPLSEGWDPYRDHLISKTIVVHSEFAGNLVREGIGADPQVIRFGVDPVFGPSARSRDWPRPLRVTTIGRLVPEKGHDTAIAAVAELLEHRRELDPHLTIAGSGPFEDDLRSRARSLGAEGRVRFVGSLETPEVAGLMTQTDVLVVASRRSADGWIEAFGRVAAEGVVSGVAVIAARSGGLPEAVGDAGCVVEPGDPSAVASAIEALIDQTSPDEIAHRTRSQAATMTIDRYWSANDALARRVAGIGGGH